MSGTKPLIVVGDQQLKRQIALAMVGAPDGYSALPSRVSGLSSRLRSRRRLVIVSSQELSRYKARSPARLTFLEKRACVIVVVEQQEAGKILEAIRIADGLVFRDINLDCLAMIAALAQFGYVAIPSALTGQVMNRGLRRELVLSLNVLEHRVLTMLGRGSPNRAISESLGLDEGRTKYLIRSVFKKLHLQNRTQAAVFARDVIADLAPFGTSDFAVASKPNTFSQHITALFS
jgi:DNA-binding CsgD family transcriptional regulator